MGFYGAPLTKKCEELCVCREALLGPVSVGSGTGNGAQRGRVEAAAAAAAGLRQEGGPNPFADARD